MTGRTLGRGRVRALALVLTGVSLLACREREPEVELPETAQGGAVELGRIGGRIYNEPERAREILEAVGMTPDEFERRIHLVTNDPALAGEYTRGFEAVLRPRSQTPAMRPDPFTDSLALDSVGDSLVVDSAAPSQPPPVPR